ncbi:hypothetical protein Ddye_026567 [Dipteronia dyeriana]|uniref:Endonuclease/exonuclease/phosphatase domain-containing protein n=1 Tax=Dipteronia dyeriana TaxID=168575 RepID=A0AAD9TMZ0_9ROSI|nr:hypothetical protein Ddye_026567 [Dipteronia dyeriana]
MGGDFNTVLNPMERKDKSYDEGSVKNFNNFVLRAGLVDILCRGMPFTWSNNIVKASWGRLDRFLFSLDFLPWFPNMRQLGLPRTLSDHNASLVGEKWEDWGPKPFRFFNGWLEDKGLMEEVVKGWNGCKTSGSKGHSLAFKENEAKKMVLGALFLPLLVYVLLLSCRVIFIAWCLVWLSCWSLPGLGF